MRQQCNSTDQIGTNSVACTSACLVLLVNAAAAWCGGAHLVVHLQGVQAAKGGPLGQIAAADNVHWPQLEGDGGWVGARAVQQALVIEHIQAVDVDVERVPAETRVTGEQLAG